MKASLALLTIGTAAFVVAQDLASLPQCGQQCINNMLQIATSQFGCAPGNVTCYCTNQNFGYGIRDCSNAACTPDQAASVMSFGASYCS
ncbi:hypothetical protein LTR66_012614, partial [Elasticomyces elasticus]